MIDLKRTVEALLFAADRPLSVDRLVEVLEEYELPPAEIRSICQALRLDYDTQNRAFELVEVADGFQLRTRPEFADIILGLRKTNPLRLSRAALETLSIIAYRQPVLRAEIERIRGVDCGGVVRALMERGLVKIRGRENLPGRPLTYGTTQRFLEVFELKNLDDLPSLEELSLEAGLDPALAALSDRDIAPGLFPDRPLASEDELLAATNLDQNEEEASPEADLFPQDEEEDDQPTQDQPTD